MAARADRKACRHGILHPEDTYQPRRQNASHNARDNNRYHRYRHKPPPWLSEIPTAIGVVTDLGSREFVIASSRPNSLHSRKTLPMEVERTTVQPTRMGSQFLQKLHPLYR